MASHHLLPLLQVRATHAVLVTLLVVAQYWLQLAAGLNEQPRLLGEVFFGMFVWDVGNFIVGFAIIAIVQQQLAPGRLRTITLVSTILVWAFLWTLWNFFEADSHFIVVERGLVTSAGSSLNGLWTTTAYLLLAAWYYESIDRATRSTAALRESELARHSAERWLLEMRLGTRQARLDPQVLFDTLDEAGRLYQSQSAAAEELLDALIDYLRRALPRLRQTESTLESEIALALAYARILRTRAGDALEVEAAVELAAGNASFPPMVAQPLCEALVRPAMGGRGQVRLRIEAIREQEYVRLCLTAEPVASAPGAERLAEIRHTLLTMFGPLARMEATSPAIGVASVFVEVPYDPTPRIDS